MLFSETSDNQLLSAQDYQEEMSSQLRQSEAEKDCIIEELKTKQEMNSNLEKKIVSGLYSETKKYNTGYMYF